MKIMRSRWYSDDPSIEVKLSEALFDKLRDESYEEQRLNSVTQFVADLAEELHKRGAISDEFVKQQLRWVSGIEVEE